MREVIHQWSDGYGASLTLTYLPSLPGSSCDRYAYVTFTDDGATDVYADATDLRAIADAAIAMAEAMEAPSAEGS